MDGRTLVIGIPPVYDYPGRLEEWSKSNTLYAANLGTCLITNSIIRQFNGTYTKDFSDIDSLNEKFDRCVLALATHIHPDRDVSLFADVVDRLDMPVFFISGGITDYAQQTNLDYAIHPSVIRLLEIVRSRSSWIGVRGHYTANVLSRHGFKDVVPIGCPSMYWNLDGPIQIIKRTQPPAKVLIPYHLTLSSQIPAWEAETAILGQDFQDHLAFTNELDDDVQLTNWFKRQFATPADFEAMQRRVTAHGIWTSEFEKWLYTIGEYDFVIGPRLHGCVAGLIQRIPTVMTTRDLRGREISDFFNIPRLNYDQLQHRSASEIYDEVDFEKFNETHALRYHNYLQFLKENGLDSRHQPAEHQRGFQFSAQDIIDRDFIVTQHLSAIWDQVKATEHKEIKRAKFIEKIARRWAPEKTD